MNSERKENDFSQGVKDKLAKRVGYLCSNPDCRAWTISASTEDSEKTINIGKAAHIRAARPKGKRYDSTMTPKERKHIDNGIWLCGNCHDAVDSDEADFTVESLLAWKFQAEAEARKNRGKSSKRPELTEFFADQSLKTHARTFEELGVTATVRKGRVTYGFDRPTNFRLSGPEDLLGSLMENLASHGEVKIPLGPGQAVFGPQDPALLPFFPKSDRGYLIFISEPTPKNLIFAVGTQKQSMAFNMKMLKNPDRVVLTPKRRSKAFTFRISLQEEKTIPSPTGSGFAASVNFDVDFQASKGVTEADLEHLRLIQLLAGARQDVVVLDRDSRQKVLVLDHQEFKTEGMLHMAQAARLLEMYIIARDFLKLNGFVRDDVPPAEVLKSLQAEDHKGIQNIFRAIESDLEVPVDFNVTYNPSTPEPPDLVLVDGLCDAQFMVEQPVFIGDRLLTVMQYVFTHARLQFFDGESTQEMVCESLKEALKRCSGPLRMCVQATSEVKFTTHLRTDADAELPHVD